MRYMVFRSALFLLFLPALIFGASSTTATVTFEVQAINEITVSGDPSPLIINSATAGSQPTSATDSSTTYAVTTNGTGKKITGSIDSNMPANTTLSITLTAPTGGTSAGSVSMSTVAANLVTGITTVAESGLGITYTFAATVSAGIVPSSMRTVTYTIVDGP